MELDSTFARARCPRDSRRDASATLRTGAAAEKFALAAIAGMLMQKLTWMLVSDVVVSGWKLTQGCRLRLSHAALRGWRSAVKVCSGTTDHVQPFAHTHRRILQS